MFLTTEPNLAGKNYKALQVIFATASDDLSLLRPDYITENALKALQAKAQKLNADGVIGVHISTTMHNRLTYSDGRILSNFLVTAVGTAIKFI
jgi:Putative heavy-metal-binding